MNTEYSKLTPLRLSLSYEQICDEYRRRLCHEASRETRMVWKMILEELAKVDPILPKFCVPMCVYRGFCPEMTSCGYSLSKQYKEEVKSYRKLIPNEFMRIKKKQIIYIPW